MNGVRATTTRGGAALAVAGVLLAIGGLRFAIPSATDSAASVWQLLGWPVGGVVLLAASVVLAIGARGEAGLVGRSGRRRAALVMSGFEPLLLIAVFLLAWTVGPAVWGLTFPILAGVQLLVFATTALVAVTVRCRGAITGAARWAFAGLAVVDAVALVLALVPPAAVAFQIVVASVRPLAVIVAGMLLALHGRAQRARENPPATRMQ